MRATEANLIFKTKKNETLNFAFSSRYRNRNMFNVKKRKNLDIFVCFVLKILFQIFI